MYTSGHELSTTGYAQNTLTTMVLNRCNAKPDTLPASEGGGWRERSEESSPLGTLTTGAK
jgi:hypothetical protein